MSWFLIYYHWSPHWCENIVMFQFQQNRLRVVFEIAQYDIFVVTFCDRYIFFDRNCIVMKFFSHLKCFKCVRFEKSCTNFSWKILNKTREKYKRKIQLNEEKLTKIISRLFQNKRILQQIDEKAKQKIEHFFEELN